MLNTTTQYNASIIDFGVMGLGNIFEMSLMEGLITNAQMRHVVMFMRTDTGVRT
jgi:hypothetical protein